MQRLHAGRWMWVVHVEPQKVRKMSSQVMRVAERPLSLSLRENVSLLQCEVVAI